MMRYIGGKSLLLSDIHEVIKTIAPTAENVIDIFAGSGVVSEYLKEQNYNVICNDQMYFSYVLLRGIIQLNKEPTFEKLYESLSIKDPIAYLNSLTIDKTEIDLQNCFIYQNYAPNKTCKRMYFTSENALKIDIIRLTIESWKVKNIISEDEYYYLLAVLVSAVPYVSNIAGVYAAYLKYWEPRALKPLLLEKPAISQNKNIVKAFNNTCNNLLKMESIKADVLYSDSPYNTREYLPNYHILETIARYDYPVIKGVTGMRDYKTQKSAFCSKATVHSAFENMIRFGNVKYFVISYNNEGLISTAELSQICQKYAVPGTFHLIEIPYRRYKNKSVKNKSQKEEKPRKKSLIEQIYYFEKKKKIYNKSPLNYIGGKYRLLPQIMKLFPENIETMVDLFCGGCDVTINTIAKRKYANDINNYVIDIFNTIKSLDINNLLVRIDEIIHTYDLSKTNKEGYLKLRNHYNQSKEKDPVELFTLVCYSFNYQFRFNAKHEYNNPFGKDRSCFNDTIRANLISFHKIIQNIEFSTNNFKALDLSKLGKKDFLYADPPYLITTGSYNDGKRGFEGWSQQDDIALFNLLDKLNKKGVRFALSNVLRHKGKENSLLDRWAQKYNIHYLDMNYSNSSYHGENTEKETVEVLITNY